MDNVTQQSDNSDSDNSEPWTLIDRISYQPEGENSCGNSSSEASLPSNADPLQELQSKNDKEKVLKQIDSRADLASTISTDSSDIETMDQCSEGENGIPSENILVSGLTSVYSPGSGVQVLDTDADVESLDTDGISVISESDMGEEFVNVPSSVKQELVIPDEPSRNSNDYFDNTDLSSQPNQDLPEDLDFRPEKKYIHQPNQHINTLLNILLVISLAAVIGLGIGHFLGLQEECPYAQNPDGDYMKVQNVAVFNLLSKLEHENQLLRSQLGQLREALEDVKKGGFLLVDGQTKDNPWMAFIEQLRTNTKKIEHSGIPLLSNSNSKDAVNNSGKPQVSDDVADQSGVSSDEKNLPTMKYGEEPTQVKLTDQEKSENSVADFEEDKQMATIVSTESVVVQTKDCVIPAEEESSVVLGEGSDVKFSDSGYVPSEESGFLAPVSVSQFEDEVEVSEENTENTAAVKEDGNKAPVVNLEPEQFSSKQKKENPSIDETVLGNVEASLDTIADFLQAHFRENSKLTHEMKDILASTLGVVSDIHQSVTGKMKELQSFLEKETEKKEEWTLPSKLLNKMKDSLVSTVKKAQDATEYIFKKNKKPLERITQKLSNKLTGLKDRLQNKWCNLVEKASRKSSMWNWFSSETVQKCVLFARSHAGGSKSSRKKDTEKVTPAILVESADENNNEEEVGFDFTSGLKDKASEYMTVADMQFRLPAQDDSKEGVMFDVPGAVTKRHKLHKKINDAESSETSLKEDAEEILEQGDADSPVDVINRKELDFDITSERKRKAIFKDGQVSEYLTAADMKFQLPTEDDGKESTGKKIMKFDDPKAIEENQKSREKKVRKRGEKSKRKEYKNHDKQKHHEYPENKKDDKRKFEKIERLNDKYSSKINERLKNDVKDKGDRDWIESKRYKYDDDNNDSEQPYQRKHEDKVLKRKNQVRYKPDDDDNNDKYDGRSYQNRRKHDDKNTLPKKHGGDPEKENKPKSEKAKMKNGFRQNDIEGYNVSGEWVMKLAQGREQQRQKEKLSEWLFERAAARRHKREEETKKADWYFHRAEGRKEQRHYANMDWCHTNTCSKFDARGRWSGDNEKCRVHVDDEDDSYEEEEEDDYDENAWKYIPRNKMKDNQRRGWTNSFQGSTKRRPWVPNFADGMFFPSV